MITKDAELLVDNYRFLEPDTDELTFEEYGEFIEQRFNDLSEIAHMYGEFCDQRGPKYSGRLPQHWQQYLEAADTVHWVYHELETRGKF